MASHGVLFNEVFARADGVLPDKVAKTLGTLLLYYISKDRGEKNTQSARAHAYQVFI